MGFFSKVGGFFKRVGPALATAIPGVGPILGPVLGGVLASRGGAGGSAQPFQLPEESPEAIEQRQAFRGGLSDLAGQATGQSQEFLEGAQGDIASARGFFTRLLEGDPQAKMEFFAPEINEARRQSQQAIESAERFVPRGGERDRLLTAGRLQRSGEITRLLSQARSTGAAGLSGLAGIGGQLGVQTGQLGLGAGEVGLQSLLTERGQDLNAQIQTGNIGLGQERNRLLRRQQNIGVAGDVGGGIADLLGTAAQTEGGLLGVFKNIFRGPQKQQAQAAQQPAPGPVSSQFESGARTATGVSTNAFGDRGPAPQDVFVNQNLINQAGRRAAKNPFSPLPV